VRDVPVRSREETAREINPAAIGSYKNP